MSQTTKQTAPTPDEIWERSSWWQKPLMVLGVWLMMLGCIVGMIIAPFVFGLSEGMKTTNDFFGISDKDEA